jgi:hypothetical protein
MGKYFDIAMLVIAIILTIEIPALIIFKHYSFEAIWFPAVTAFFSWVYCIIVFSKKKSK